MCHLISSKDVFYDRPQTVNVGGRAYDNIIFSRINDIIDGDNKRKQVHVMDSTSANFITYVQGDKVIRSEEHYVKPLTKRLGNKVYSNITSKLEVEGKNCETYIIESPFGNYNKVRVYPSGHIMDCSELQNRVILRKLAAPFKKFAQLIR